MVCDSRFHRWRHAQGLMNPCKIVMHGQGKIINAGHPAGMNIGDEVDALLKPAKQ